MATTTPRMSAEQRRAQVVRAAVAEFSRRGFEGTSTEAIAARVGVSQPYLFRLFPSKKNLYLETLRYGFERISRCFEEAAEGLVREEALGAMANAYNELIADRDLLLLQLQLFASCHDEDVQKLAREEMGRLWVLVTRVTGLRPEQLVEFFAFGMLCNVITATESDRLRELVDQFGELPVDERAVPKFPEPDGAGTGSDTS